MANFYGKNRETDFAASKLMSFGKSFSRMNGQPLDESEVWYNKADLEAFAAGNSAYVGMKLVYVDEANQKVYQYSVQYDGTVKEIGTSPVGDNKSITVDAETATVSLYGISGLTFERDKVNEEGEPTGEKENIRYQPLMTKDGLVWVEPSKTTVEGLATLLSDLTTRVDSAETDIDNLQSDVSEIKKFFTVAEDETLSDALDTLKEIQDFLDTTADEDGLGAIISSINDNSSAIDVLNGEATEEGSVAKAVADAVSTYSSTADGKFATQSAVNTINDKLKDIEANADVNIIEVVKVNGTALTPDENKAVNVVVPVNFSDLTDDSGFTTLIQTAQNTANQGVSDASAAAGAAATAQAKADANEGEINTLKSTVSGHTTTIGEHGVAIANLQQADADHAVQYSSLASTVEGHGTVIAALESTYTKQETHNALVGRVAANETAIATLNNTTIPGINTEIGKKANSADVYTKTEIGTIPEGSSSLVDYINTQSSKNDTTIAGHTSALTALIGEDTGKSVRAIASEEVAKIVDEAPEAFDTLKEIADWIANDESGAAAMSSAIAANTGAINAINNSETGILAQAKTYTNEEIAKLPTVDGSSIQVVDNKYSVKAISTDLLVQGDVELVFNGGNSKGF